MKGLTFIRGDKVYLLRKNIKTKRLSDKLDFKKIRLFKVEEVILVTNYRLSLLSIMRIHLVFYISLLELVLTNAKLETTLEIETDQYEYEVKTILDKKKFGNT